MARTFKRNTYGVLQAINEIGRRGPGSVLVSMKQKIKDTIAYILIPSAARTAKKLASSWGRTHI